MHKNSGFSLLELIIVISLIAIVTAITIPNVLGWLPDYRMKSAASDLMSNFQKTKITAIKRNTDCTATFNANGYDVYIDADGDWTYDAGETLIFQVSLTEYKGVTIDTSQGGGDGISFTNNATAFRPNGIPTNAGTIFFVNTNNNTTSVVVSTAGNVRID